MSKETVNILMATYNGEKYLEEQIRSILNQSHQQFRLLICDDHSKDGTGLIIDRFVEEFPDKIVKIISEKNLGAKGNFSFLMEHAMEYSKTDYIMFSDQDDIWKSEKVAKTLAEMKELEKTYGSDLPLLVHTDLAVVDKNCAVLGQSFWKYSNLKAFHFRTTNRLIIQNVVTGCTIMMNQNLCKLSLPIPPESLMHDWWIALVAATFGKIGLVNESTILYRQHGANTLGAQKFGLFRFLKNGFIKLLSNNSDYEKQMDHRKNQAKTFLKRYQDQLSAKEQQMIQAYFNFNDLSWFKKRIIVVKYGFYRSGWIRNFLTFLIRLNP